MQGMMMPQYMKPQQGGGGIIIIFIIVSLIIGGGVFWYINFSNCKNYTCPDGYDIVDDAENVSGYDEEKCCTELKCFGNVDQTKDHTCEDGTILKGDASNITNISQESCCETSGVSISTKFSESWNDLSEPQKENFVNNYISFISRKLNVLDSDIVIQDGYPKEGSTIVVCKVNREDITKDTINQELTGIESEEIGGLTILSVSVKDTNYEAELEISSSYVPSSSSGCSDSRYQGEGCSKCSEHHYVKENADGTFTCETCPNGTGWDWSKEIGSDTNARIETKDNDCFPFTTDCPSNNHVEGKYGACISCNDTYFGLTTSSAEPIGTHNSEQKGPNYETLEEGPGSKCRFLKNGWGGPPANDDTLKQEIDDTTYGIAPSIPPPFTRNDISAEEGFSTDDTKSTDIYDTFPSDSRNKIDHLFIRQCPPETHSASYTLTNEIFKLNQVNDLSETVEEVISEDNNIFTKQKEKEYNCYRKNICSSFKEEEIISTSEDLSPNNTVVRRTGTINTIFNDLSDEKKVTLNESFPSNITCATNEEVTGCTCTNEDGSACDESKNCNFMDTTHGYETVTASYCTRDDDGNCPEECSGVDSVGEIIASCVETATEPDLVQADTTACDAVTGTDLENSTACDAVMTTADTNISACTYTPRQEASCTPGDGECTDLISGSAPNCMAKEAPEWTGICEVKSLKSFVPDKVGFGFIYSNEKDCHESKLCGENNDEQCMWFPGSKVNTFIDHLGLIYESEQIHSDLKGQMRCGNSECTDSNNNGQDILRNTNNSFDECKIRNKIAILNYNEEDDTLKIIDSSKDEGGLPAPSNVFYNSEKCYLKEGSLVDHICMNNPEYSVTGENVECGQLNAIECENQIDEGNNQKKCKLQGVCYDNIGRDYDELLNTSDCNGNGNGIKKSLCEYKWDKNRICDENECDFSYDSTASNTITELNQLNSFKTEAIKGLPEKNAIMGYEYRRKIQDLVFKEREKNMEMEEDLRNPREIQILNLGNGISLFSTLSSKWNCDINNDVIFPPEGCSPGFYSKQETDYDDNHYGILDKKMIKDGPNYSGSNAKIEGNTSCSLCKPWRGNDSDRELKRYEFSPSSPFYSRNGQVECLKCSNTGTCTMPRCNDGYFYDRRTRRCQRCTAIANQDENINDYSGLYESNYPIKCTNRNDSRFNDIKVLPKDNNGSYDIRFHCELKAGRPQAGAGADPADPPQPGLDNRKNLKCLDSNGIVNNDYELIKLDTINEMDEKFIDGYCDIKSELEELDPTMTFFGDSGGNVLTLMNEDENNEPRLLENNYIFNQLNNKYYRNDYFRYTVNSAESNVTCSDGSDGSDDTSCRRSTVNDQNSTEKIFFVEVTDAAIDSIDKCYDKSISEKATIVPDEQGSNEIIGFNYDDNNYTCELIVKNGSEFSPSMEGGTEKEIFNILNLEQYTPSPTYDSIPDLNTYLVYDDYPDYPKIQCNFKNKNECETFISGNRASSNRDFCKWRGVDDLIKKDCVQNYSLPTPTINDKTYISELNTILDETGDDAPCDSSILDNIYDLDNVSMGLYYRDQQECNLKLLKKLQDVNSTVNQYSNYNSIFQKITDDNLSEDLVGGETLNGKGIKKLKDTNLSKFKCGFPCKPGYYLDRGQDKDQCLPCNLSENSNNLLETDCINNENCNLTCSIDRDGEIKGESFMCKPGYLYENGSCISCIGEGTESFLGIYSDPNNTDQKYYSCSIPPDPDVPDSISPDIKITACKGSNDDEIVGNVYSKVSGFCTKVTSSDPPLPTRIDGSQLENILLNHGIFTSQDYIDSNLSLEEDKDSYEKCGTCIKQTIDFQDELKLKIFTKEESSRTKEHCENRNDPNNTKEIYFWKTFTLDEINDNEEFDDLTEKYIWTSDKCIPCKGTWETVLQPSAEYDNDNLYDSIKFKNCCTIQGCDGCPSDVVKCPYHQNEKPSYVAELPELNNNDNDFYNLKKLNKERHKRMPLKNTLHGVAIASTYSNKGYEPSFEPHKIANQGGEAETEYYKRNNSWGIVNNDRVEDPAICERSISLEQPQTTDSFRENFNSAIWPTTWLGDSRGEDFDVWDNHYISLGEWNMNVDRPRRAERPGENLPFFTSPDNRGWLSAQLKTRHPVTDGQNQHAMTTFFYRPMPNVDRCNDSDFAGTFQPIEPEHGAIDVRDISKISGSRAAGGCASIKSDVGQPGESKGTAYTATANTKMSVPYHYAGDQYYWLLAGGGRTGGEVGAPIYTGSGTKYLGYLNSKYPFKHNNNLYGDKYLKWGRMKRNDRVFWNADGNRTSQYSNYTQPRLQHSHCESWDYKDNEQKYACGERSYIDYDPMGYERTSGYSPEKPYGYHLQHTGDTCFSFKGGNDASFINASPKHKYRNLCAGSTIGAREEPASVDAPHNSRNTVFQVSRREDPVSSMMIRVNADHGLALDGDGNDFGEESNYPRNYGTDNNSYIQRSGDVYDFGRTMNAGVNIAARQWAYISDDELSDIVDIGLTVFDNPAGQINEAKGETLNTYGRDINKNVTRTQGGYPQNGAAQATGGYHSKSWHDVYKPIRASTYPFNNLDSYNMNYFDPDFSYGWSGINIDLNNVHGSDGNPMGVNYTSRGVQARFLPTAGAYGDLSPTRRHGQHHIYDKYMTGRGIGGGGRMGGDFEYSASTLDAKRVEDGVPGVCFVNRIGGGTTGQDTSWEGNSGSSVRDGRSGKDVQFFDNSDTRIVTGGQVWTGRTYWGTKENEENWVTLNNHVSANGWKAAHTMYDENKHKNAVLPKHDGYGEKGLNKNRPLTGYMLVDLGDYKVPKEGTEGVMNPMTNESICGASGRAACNRLRYRRDIGDNEHGYIADYKMGAGLTESDFDFASDSYPGDKNGGGSYDTTTEQCFYILTDSDIKQAGDEKNVNMFLETTHTGRGGTGDRSMYSLFRDDEGGAFTPYHIGRHYDSRMLANTSIYNSNRGDSCSGGNPDNDHWIFEMDSCNADLNTQNLWTHMDHPFEFDHTNSSSEDAFGASGILRTNLVSEQFDETINSRNPGSQTDSNGFISNIDSKFFEIKELNKGYITNGGNSLDRGRKYSSGDIRDDPSAPYNDDFQIYEAASRVGAGGTSSNVHMNAKGAEIGNILHLSRCDEVDNTVRTGDVPYAIESNEWCKTNVNYGLDPNLYDFSLTGNKFSRRASADKIKGVSVDPSATSGDGTDAVQRGKESTGESWTHNNISRILVDSDPIFKGVGSKTQGKESNITDKEFKTCSDYCSANPNCTGFTYRDYFTKLKDDTGANHNGFNPIYADKINNDAGLCCLKTKDPGSKIVKGENNANVVVDPGKNQGYYEPYTTFIQCPKDPVYSELEEKIMGVSKLNTTGNIERINTMNDIYLAKKAGYEDGTRPSTSTASDKELIRSKTMTGQLLAAYKNQKQGQVTTAAGSGDTYPLTMPELGITGEHGTELTKHLKEISATDKYDLRKKFSKKYAFTNTHDTNSEALYGAGKEAVGCLDVASEVNKTLKESTLDYNHRYALRNHFLGGPLGVETYEKLSDNGSGPTAESEGIGGQRQTDYGNKNEAALAVFNLGKIPRSGDHISNVWDTDLYPIDATSRGAQTWLNADHTR